MDMSFNDPGGFATVGFASGDGAIGLRPLTWHGLCARISAAQDLRRALSAVGTSLGVSAPGSAVPASGSFHRQAAAFIASGIPGVPPHMGVGEHIVNPNSSANGKANPGTPEDLNTGARSGRAEA
jgi:hypothetical protein